MKTKPKTSLFNDLVVKLIACLFIIICLAVGVVGLVLPIIPGILFMAIAAMIAAHFFPSMNVWLRKNQTISRYLDSSDGFMKLSFLSKLQFSCWLCIKVFIDSMLFIFMLISKILSFGASKLKSNT